MCKRLQTLPGGLSCSSQGGYLSGLFSSDFLGYLLFPNYVFGKLSKALYPLSL